MFIIRDNNRLIALISMIMLLLCLPINTVASDSFEWSLMAEASLISVDNDDNRSADLASWLDKGTGLLRYHDGFEGAQLSQLSYEASAEYYDCIAARISLKAYPDGHRRLGVTEAYLDHWPLMPIYKHRIKFGAFYPTFGYENPLSGWNSPYTYTGSAISSWIAEEVRTIGIEWAAVRAGNRHQSAHTWGLTGALFGFNDGIGSLLAWRGFALHNRQTMLGERIDFADYPTLLTGRLEKQPEFVKPFAETDKRLGHYLGVDWRYKREMGFKVYYYDNNANHTKTEDSGQYAWQTRFTSYAWQWRLNRSLRLIAHGMVGRTYMGLMRDVVVDFDTWYLMASQSFGKQRITLRYDQFQVDDVDNNALDLNDSDGDAWTLAWRIRTGAAFDIGFEWMSVSSSVDSRAQWNYSTDVDQTQLLFVVQYSIDGR